MNSSMKTSALGRAAARRRPAAVRAAGRRAAARRKRVARRGTLRRSARKPPGSRAVQALPAVRGSLSVIICARNEQHTLQQLLQQVVRLQPAEIIVVLNGCSDQSFQLAREVKQAVIVHCPQPAGHDVGRAIGAKLSRGDILLFLDGDMVIPARQLALFTAAVDQGLDVALNNLDPLLPPFGLADDVSRSKLYLNDVLGRRDLGVSSMTAVPHALSRHALQTIGYRELMVPPKAHAISLLEQLRVGTAGTVNVIKHNRLRQGNTGIGNPMEQLITGDHAEALQEILSRREAGGQPPLLNETLSEQRRQMAAWRNGL